MKIPQLRLLPEFFRTMVQMTNKYMHSKKHSQSKKGLHSLEALFTAMASTIGMGNVVGPSVAVFIGGPSALFWLVCYIFFASAIKYVEVSWALRSRKIGPDGQVIGGPIHYLEQVHPKLSKWYGFIMVLLFPGWSALQSNTLASLLLDEGIHPMFVGGLLAFLLFLVLKGGKDRVGKLAGRLVPLMFVLYVSFSSYILLQRTDLLFEAISSIFTHLLDTGPLLGGMAGFGVLKSMQAGVYRGIFVTEAGLGTSSIAHSVAETNHPTQQGTLAMFSMMVDCLLSLLSGLMILVSGVWRYGEFRSTLIYEAFKLHAPLVGQIVLLVSIILFVFTTVIGNGYNGLQNFKALTRFRFQRIYVFVLIVSVFFGATLKAKFVWDLMDFLLAMVALPNLIGVVILAFKDRDFLRYPLTHGRRTKERSPKEIVVGISSST